MPTNKAEELEPGLAKLLSNYLQSAPNFAYNIIKADTVTESRIAYLSSMMAMRLLYSYTSAFKVGKSEEFEKLTDSRPATEDFEGTKLFDRRGELIRSHDLIVKLTKKTGLLMKIGLTLDEVDEDGRISDIEA